MMPIEDKTKLRNIHDEVFVMAEQKMIKEEYLTVSRKDLEGEHHHRSIDSTHQIVAHLGMV